MLTIYLEFARVGDFDSHLIVTIKIIFCVYKMTLMTILIAWKHAISKPGVFWLTPSMGKSRWLRILTVFQRRILTKIHMN